MLLNKYFKNTLIFPYGYEFAPILVGLLKNKNIDSSAKVVSLEGWGVIGMDAGLAFGRPYIGINIIGDIKKHIAESDTFIAVPFKDTGKKETNELVNSIIDESIKIAISMGKTIIDLRDVNSDYIPIVEDHIDIECPIIFVNGITEQLNKLNVMLELSHSLSEKGYKVSQIGTRHYCDIIGMYSFPQFMFDEMQEVKKIKAFRTYISNIYKKEKPDVIIIGIPGAAIPFNDNVHNRFGITHYLVSMAVKADFTITCSDLELWDYEKLDVHFAHRFGHGIDCVVLSNTKLFYNIQEFPDKLFYETQDYEAIDQIKIKAREANREIPIYDIFNRQDVESLTDLIINDLSDTAFYKL